MLTEFKKFAGFKILIYFLFNSDLEIHIKELARKLKISPSTAKYYCDFLKKENILEKDKKGNMVIFSLNNSSMYVKELKKTYTLIYLKDLGIETLNKKHMSIAVYGSYSSGEFNEKSDLDILIIGKKKEVNKDLVLKLEKKFEKEIQLTILSYYEWEKMKKNKDAFALEVLSNHILIKGVEL